jgi:hypothetical protein
MVRVSVVWILSWWGIHLSALTDVFNQACEEKRVDGQKGNPEKLMTSRVSGENLNLEPHILLFHN